MEQMLKTVEQKNIFSFSTVTGTVRVKLQEKGTYKTITLIDDLRDFFPDEHFNLS